VRQHEPARVVDPGFIAVESGDDVLDVPADQGIVFFQARPVRPWCGGPERRGAAVEHPPGEPADDGNLGEQIPVGGSSRPREVCTALIESSTVTRWSPLAWVYRSVRPSVGRIRARRR
jgi:hypothetical protein